MDELDMALRRVTSPRGFAEMEAEVIRQGGSFNEEPQRRKKSKKKGQNQCAS